MYLHASFISARDRDEWLYCLDYTSICNKHNYVRQHYLFIKTYATCFDQTLGHPQACGRLSHWCCVYIVY